MMKNSPFARGRGLVCDYTPMHEVTPKVVTHNIDYNTYLCHIKIKNYICNIKTYVYGKSNLISQSFNG